MQTQEEIRHPEAGDAESPNFPAFDVSSFPPQLVWLAISFVLLYVIMARAALPKVARVLSERQDRIADDLDEAERMQAEAREVRETYEAMLAQARAKAQSILNKARDEAREHHDARMRELEARLDEKVAAAQREIAKAQEQALQELESIAQEAAAGAVEKIVGKRVDRETIEAAVAAARAERRKAA